MENACRWKMYKPKRSTSLSLIMKLYTTLGLLLIAVTYSSASINNIEVLSLPDISGWKKQAFSGDTAYILAKVDNDRHALKAISHGSASGLIRKVDVDLRKTPYINWSWKVDFVLNDIDETKKTGDDYAARVYVLMSSGLFFWQTRALSYVWSSEQPQGSHWPNAFSTKAMMIAVESGEELQGKWVNEKRNVLEDIKHFLGSDVTHINAVAIMTDTDNSQQSAVAYYGDIYFSSE